MKIIAYYDFSGTIRSLVAVDAPAGMHAMVTPEPGLLVAEVEIGGLHLQSDAPNAQDLRRIAQTHKMAMPLPSCKLVKKS